MTCIINVLDVIMFTNSNIRFACEWVYKTIALKYDFVAIFWHLIQDWVTNIYLGWQQYWMPWCVQVVTWDLYVHRYME